MQNRLKSQPKSYYYTYIIVLTHQVPVDTGTGYSVYDQYHCNGSAKNCKLNPCLKFRSICIGIVSFRTLEFDDEFGIGLVLELNRD